MNKKLIRLTEQDLHRIIKESVSKILKESYIDATPYEYDVDDGDEFDKISKGFAKMPKGYDNDLDIEGDYPTIDKIAMLNKDSEAEAYPNIKKREIDASWKALKNQTPRKPIDPHFDKAFRTDNRFAAKNYTSNKR